MIDNISAEDIRQLSQLERDMDSGQQPYVLVAGEQGRFAVSHDCLKEFGLETGQTVTNFIVCKILEWNIALTQSMIALSKASENQETLSPPEQ